MGLEDKPRGMLAAEFANRLKGKDNFLPTEELERTGGFDAILTQTKAYNTAGVQDGEGPLGKVKVETVLIDSQERATYIESTFTADGKAGEATVSYEDNDSRGTPAEGGTPDLASRNHAVGMNNVAQCFKGPGM